jgi:tRNA acetyltransferase TAN1
MREFDLLVSCARGNEAEANSEIRYIIGELGDRQSVTDKTDVSGLTVVRSSLDPVNIISNLRTLLRSKPWQFRYVLKIKPIQKVVDSNIADIQSAARHLSNKIGLDETFRVSIEKRKSKLSSKEIIDAVALIIKRKVNLTVPDKIVLVEIIGPYTGISIINQKDVFSVEKEKRIYPSNDSKADRSMTSRFNASTSSLTSSFAASNSFSVTP